MRVLKWVTIYINPGGKKFLKIFFLNLIWNLLLFYSCLAPIKLRICSKKCKRKESFDTPFDIGYGSVKSPICERVKLHNFDIECMFEPFVKGSMSNEIALRICWSMHVSCRIGKHGKCYLECCRYGSGFPRGRIWITRFDILINLNLFI